MSDIASVEQGSSGLDYNDDNIRKEYVFVTGGTGLVGSHLIEQLLRQGRRVKALYRNTIPDFPRTDQVQWVQGDILDIVLLEDLLIDVDQVYHCAAMVSYNPKKRNELFRTNVDGTANIVNASLDTGISKLCFVSSVAALGKTNDGSGINEKTNWNEEDNGSNYGKSKYLAEVEIWRGIGEGLNAVIVNPTIILGAGKWNDSSTKIFKTAYDEFPWYTEGVTGFVDVNDVVTAMMQLMDSDISGERFLLNAENRPFKEIFSLAAYGFARKAPHKKVSRVAAGIVWRTEAVKAMFTGEEPLLTAETAEAAQSVRIYDNNKLKRYLPSFVYTPIEETIERVCNELKTKFHLS